MLLSLAIINTVHAEIVPSVVTETQVTDEQYQYQANVNYWPGWANFATKQEAAQAELDSYSIPTNCIWGDSPHLTGLYVINAYGTIDALAEGYRGYCPSTYGYHNEYYTSWIGIGRVSGCHPSTFWNGSGCVRTSYSCPSTGTWALSADQQTCTGCWDPTQILDQNNACVDEKDKDAGGPDCQKPTDQPPPPFWSE